MDHGWILALGDRTPRVAPRAFVHPAACLIGDVVVEDDCFVGPFAVLRADHGPIRLAPGSNVQDGAVLHACPGGSVVVGRDAQVGHGAVLHGCTLRDNALVGIRATVLDGAEIGRDSLVAAHALVLAGCVVAAGVRVAGTPARLLRQQTTSEIEAQRASARRYAAAAAEYRAAYTARR